MPARFINRRRRSSRFGFLAIPPSKIKDFCHLPLHKGGEYGRFVKRPYCNDGAMRLHLIRVLPLAKPTFSSRRRLFALSVAALPRHLSQRERQERGGLFTEKSAGFVCPIYKQAAPIEPFRLFGNSSVKNPRFLPPLFTQGRRIRALREAPLLQ